MREWCEGEVSANGTLSQKHDNRRKEFYWPAKRRMGETHKGTGKREVIDQTERNLGNLKNGPIKIRPRKR